VEDYAGALVASGGTKTGITITYQDGDGDMDFVVSDTTVAGDSGSTGMTPGDTLTIAGGTNATTAMSGDTLTVNVDDAFLKNNADDTTTGTITIDKTTSTTNAVTDVLTLQSQSSGTPANNIGVGMAFGFETSAGNVETGARIAAIAKDVDGTNEDIDLVVYTMLSGDAANEALRIHDDGNLTIAGDLTISGGNITNAITFDTSLALDSVTISTLQTGSESFVDNDTSLMTSAAIQDKILSYGYTINTGDITGVDLTGGTGIAIASESGTTSGNYSAAINCNLEGTELISTGEGGSNKFLRENGDNTCSWQTPTNTQLTVLMLQDYRAQIFLPANPSKRLTT